MSSDLMGAENQAELRLRALQRLLGTDDGHASRKNSSEAFRVLHDLASTPATAAAALAMLHELQVHQVELDLQDEELRRSRAELETTVIRQVMLYDFAPVGCFTVDRSTSLRELNLTAAVMLGADRDQLLGLALTSFLEPQSARALQAMLGRIGDGAPTAVDALRLARGQGTPRRVQASANRDPYGEHFFIAFVDVDQRTDVPPA